MRRVGLSHKMEKWRVWAFPPSFPPIYETGRFKGMKYGFRMPPQTTVLVASIRTFVVIMIGMDLATSSQGAGPQMESAPSDPASAPPETLAPPTSGIWQGAVGDGFLRSVQTLSLEAGASVGQRIFGGQQVHDLAWLSLSYGHILSKVVGEDHWYRGNWEGRVELFGAAQFYPKDVPVGGFTPHLRYDLATGTRWVPFADGGAGLSASGIGPPDNSGTFEFNLQANVGAHWFLRDNLALTFEVGLLHLSCAGIHDPNQGVNTVKGMLGLTWFF